MNNVFVTLKVDIAEPLKKLKKAEKFVKRMERLNHKNGFVRNFYKMYYSPYLLGAKIREVRNG